MHLREALAHTTAYATPESFESFSRHLDEAWIEEALLSTGTSTVRRRRLPSEQVVWLVLGMALMRDKPVADVVDHLELALPARKGNVMAASGVHMARRRIGSEPLEWLFWRSATEWAERSAARERWRGLSLWALDGTTLRVPDSDENRDRFGGQPAGEKGRGDSGYPQLRLVVLMALRSHVIAAARFGPYLTDERTHAEDLWSSLPDRSLVILDRNYLQGSVMARSDEARDRHWLMRAKTNTTYRTIERLGISDFLVEKEMTWHTRTKEPTVPRTIVMRAIEYRLGREKRILLTSLLDAKKYPATEIVALYRERWEIELGYDEMKTELLDREETIRSKTPDGVAQELWGILVAYNLVRVEIERIADELKVAPLRISFVEALRLMRELWMWSAITRTPGAIPSRLTTMAARISRLVLPPRRSSRSYPRTVKIKMSNYDRNRRNGRLK